MNRARIVDSPSAETTLSATAQRRTGPLARVNLFRLGITVAIVVTAVLAFTLQAGVFRLLFRGVLVVGAILLFGSYLWQWWMKRGRRKTI